MDGFHLSNAELDSAGLRSIKGTPQTFAVRDYVSCLRAVRGGATTAVPAYSRKLHDVLNGVYKFGPEHRVVITEGNYLLLDAPDWRTIHSLADLTIFLDAGEQLCVARLLERHLQGGKTTEEASHKIETVDRRNYRLVHSRRIDPTLTLSAEDISVAA
jgi:pantothenate kinase